MHAAHPHFVNPAFLIRLNRINGNSGLHEAGGRLYEVMTILYQWHDSPDLDLLISDDSSLTEIIWGQIDHLFSWRQKGMATVFSSLIWLIEYDSKHVDRNTWVKSLSCAMSSSLSLFTRIYTYIKDRSAWHRATSADRHNFTSFYGFIQGLQTK